MTRVRALLLASFILLVCATGVAVAAVLSAGSPDPGFGSSGVVDDDFYGTNQPDIATALVRQGDGKLVITGSSGSGGSSPILLVARYNANGTRDATFGPPPHGFEIQQICFSSSCGGTEGDAVALTPDGHIVVAGVDVNNQAFFVARFNADGSLDSTFVQAGGNSAGEDSFQIGGITTNYKVSGVAVQSDGKILVGGTANGKGFVARVAAGGGSLDTAGFLSPQGYVLGSAGSSYTGLALQSNGNIDVVGSLGVNLRVVQYTTTGTLMNAADETIGVGPDSGAGIALGGSDVIAVGTDGTGGSQSMALFALKQSGLALDPGFAGGGEERVPIPGDTSAGMAVTADASGRLLAAGFTSTAGHGYVARFSAAGALDSSFGSGGFAKLATAGQNVSAAVAADPSGNALVAGKLTPTGRSDSDVLLARLLGTATTITSSTSTSSTATVTTTVNHTVTTTRTTTLIVAPPRLTSLRESHTSWRVGTALAKPAAAKKPAKKKPTPPTGTTFTYALASSAPATVTVSFTRHTGSGRHRRTVSAGSLSFSAKPGRRKLSFAGRLSRSKKLATGSYTATFTAKNIAGKSSGSVNFTIVR